MTLYIMVTLTTGQRTLINLAEVERMDEAQFEDDKAGRFVSIILKGGSDTLHTRDTLEAIQRQLNAEDTKRLMILGNLQRSVTNVAEVVSELVSLLRKDAAARKDADSG